MYVIEVDGVGVVIMTSGRFHRRTHPGAEDQYETTRRVCGGDGQGGTARAEGDTGHEDRRCMGATAGIR
jgi:hypothetical protein